MPTATSGAYTLNHTDIVSGITAERYVLRVRDMAEQEKPREKMLAYGPKDLTLTELMAILLGVGKRREEVISTGSLTASIIHPREVFQPAIEHGAVAVIVAHNHPSGMLTPTSADRAVTKQLIAGGQILGIELLDHLIIAGKSYKSIIGGAL